MLFSLIVSTFRKIRIDLLRNPFWGRYELGFLATIVFYNLTEATFKGLSLTWFIFFIVTIKYPSFEQEPVAEASETQAVQPEAEVMFVAD